MTSLILRGLITIISLTNMACRSSDNSIILIPEGYQGKITIFLDQSRGEIKRYEEGNRVFKLPLSGVMFSQFEKPSNLAGYKVFYLSKDGARREIPYIDFAEIDTTIRVDSEATYIYRAGYSEIILSENQTLKNVAGYKPGDTVKTIGIVLSSPKNWHSIADSMLKQHESYFELTSYKTNE